MRIAIAVRTGIHSLTMHTHTHTLGLLHNENELERIIISQVTDCMLVSIKNQYFRSILNWLNCSRARASAASATVETNAKQLLHENSHVLWFAL